MQNRFKSVVLWSAVISQIVSVMLLTNVVTIAESEIITNVAASGLQILTLLGVLNNPTDSTRF